MKICSNTEENTGKPKKVNILHTNSIKFQFTELFQFNLFFCTDINTHIVWLLLDKEEKKHENFYLKNSDQFGNRYSLDCT